MTYIDFLILNALLNVPSATRLVVISESRVAPCACESRVRVFGAREYAILLTFRPEPACAWYTFQGCNSLSISDNLAQLSQEEEADDGKEVTWGTRGHPYQHDLF